MPSGLCVLKSDEYFVETSVIIVVNSSLYGIIMCLTI